LRFFAEHSPKTTSNLLKGLRHRRTSGVEEHVAALGNRSHVLAAGAEERIVHYAHGHTRMPGDVDRTHERDIARHISASVR
jgi:hypothetical protein